MNCFAEGLLRTSSQGPSASSAREALPSRHREYARGVVLPSPPRTWSFCLFALSEGGREEGWQRGTSGVLDVTPGQNQEIGHRGVAGVSVFTRALGNGCGANGGGERWTRIGRTQVLDSGGVKPGRRRRSSSGVVWGLQSSR